MTLRVGYDAESMRATFACEVAEARSVWFPLLRRTLEDSTRDIATNSDTYFSVPWWSFLNARGQVLQVIRAYQVPYEIDDEARPFLLRASQRASAFSGAAEAPTVDDVSLDGKLRRSGFARKLTSEQRRNVRRLASLPAAATFSVPGAGKTTEALAYFSYRKSEGAHLLVIAPKNAFVAWEEQLSVCLPGEDRFVRLTGGRDLIAALLQARPSLMLITYQQLTRVADIVAGFVAANDTFVFLDESHRIKSGVGRVTVDAALRLSHLPVGKLILSGTPMPQSSDDLLPQLSFLYPEVKADAQSVSDLLRPIYVRTTKAELGLRPPDRFVVPIQMAEHQSHLYRLMKFEIVRLGDSTLTLRNRQAFRALGRSIMRLLQVVSNPALLAREIGFAHDGVLGAVLAEGDSPKVTWAVQRARQLAREGKKSIIWTSFRENVEIIAKRLIDLRAVFIHGSVITGDDDDDDTREGRIRVFHDDPNCFVMVANPAAAAEGISLHMVCHNAIYVDRTYNAAHYLQSEDRIHRLGLDPAQPTTVEILECVDSIDESVTSRLKAKVDAMATVLNDASLRIDPIKLGLTEIDDSIENQVEQLEEDDVRSALELLGRTG
jgi:SNF2 family DNA or RNA helicase